MTMGSPQASSRGRCLHRAIPTTTTGTTPTPRPPRRHRRGRIAQARVRVPARTWAAASAVAAVVMAGPDHELIDMTKEIDASIGPALELEQFSVENPDWDQAYLRQEALDAMRKGMSAERATIIYGATIVAQAIEHQERPAAPAPK
jgi:hypothetical protein